MEVTGKIKEIFAEVLVSASFKKRELVIATEEQYPQYILIEFHQDKCDLLNNFRAGQSVTVSINLRGREWVNPRGETKYFNQIQGWKIVGEGAAAKPQPPAAQQAAFEEPEEPEDDLPF